MKSIVQNAAPNIIAGVNFNTDRFKELYNWIGSIAADGLSPLLMPNRYGLVMPFDGKSALELHQTGNHISVSRCSAITKGGVVIGIFEGFSSVLETSLPQHFQQNQSYYIVLEVDVSKRTAFGANSKDMPERPRFSMPTYQISFRGFEEDLGIQSNVLRIGALSFEDGAWALKNYIPPCVHLGAFSPLQHKYSAYQGALNHLLDYLPKIIRQTDAFNDAGTMGLREFCMQIGSFLAQKASAYQNLGPYGNPYQVFQLWSGFAGLVDFLLKRLRDQAKGQFYDFLAKNTQHGIGINFHSNRLEDSLQDLAKLQFQQHDLLLMIQKIDEVLDLILPLFKGLSIRFVTLDQPDWNPQQKEEKKPISNSNNGGYFSGSKW